MKRITIQFKEVPRDQMIADFVAAEIQFSGESESSVIKNLLFQAINQSNGVDETQKPKKATAAIKTVAKRKDDENNLLGDL